MKKLLIYFLRFLNGLRRPSRKKNSQLLKLRKEDLASLITREAVLADVPALAVLHVKTWSDTYPMVKTPPTFQTREWQWRKAFTEENKGNWFCLVLENTKGELVGFAKGIKHEDREYKGELNKLYLLGEYQRMGLGRKLVAEVVKRFLDSGIQSLSCYVDPSNPSCRFFEKLGGKWLREPDGKINYSWYVWKDARPLALA